MNKKIRNLISRICLVTMTLSATFSYDGKYSIALADVLSPENGVGSISEEEQYELAQGFFLKSFNANSPTTKEQKVNTLTFNPKTADINVLMSYGSSVFSRKTLTTMVNAATEEGYTVIGGVNGDFFQVDSGVPVGLTVQNGKLIGANGKGWNAEGAKREFWNAIGFKKDGSAIIGNPDISLSYTVNKDPKEQNILQFNRKRNELGVFLYTSDYSANTQTDMNSLDIVLSIVQGDVKLGQTIKCKVEKITEEVKYTPLDKDKLLLSAEVYTPGFFQLKELKLGDEINILMTDKSGQWNDVVQASGGYKSLLKNGEVQASLDTTDRYPTTAVGIKANGEVVFVQIDGRQPGWSNGIPHNDTAHYLKSIGCVDAILLDGGGSSTMVAKMPFEEKVKLMNKPSDGKERAVGNGLLFLAKAKRTNEVEKLYAYPNIIKILKGASYALNIKATDASYYPVATPNSLTYEVSPNIGKVSAQGVFTASQSNGTGSIKISSNGISTVLNVEIVDKITDIKAFPDSIVLAPGKTQLINTEVYFGSNIIIGNNDQLNWSLSDPKLGTIDNKGNFTASSSANIKGSINISYGDYTKKIDVQVGKMPVIIEDFENTIVYPNTGGKWSYSGAKFTSLNAEIISNDTEHIKSGNKGLKLTYDFTGRNDGIAGAYVHPINSLSPNNLPSKQQDMIKLEGYPTAIGMWVYGDGSHNWLRGQLRDGNNNPISINFTSEYDGKSGGIDWIGWRYVEAKLPEGLTLPLYTDVPVRVMCTRNEYRTKGTLYIDEIKAVYGYDGNVVPNTPDITKISELVDSALTTKTFYNYNIALYEITKLADGYDKAVLLSKLATIENIVWSEDIKQIYSDLRDLVTTGSAKIYDETQVKINNSTNLAAVDKDYLLWELTTWGKELVWTEDYKTALNYYINFYNSKDKASADIAEKYIKEIHNNYSREYLLEQLNMLKEFFNIK